MDNQAELEQIRKIAEAEVRVKELTRAINDESAALMKAIKEAREMGASQTHLNAIWANGSRDIAAYKQQLAAYSRDIATTHRDMGQSMLYLGNSIQDFQAAGLRGILNNIPQVVMALGGTGGLAGALTVAAVAFESFRPQIDKFLEGLRGGAKDIGKYTTEIERLTGRVEALKKVENPTSQQSFELNTAERALKEAQRLGGIGAKADDTRSPLQQAIAGAIPGGQAGPKWNNAIGQVRANLVDELLGGIVGPAEAEIKSLLAEQANISAGSLYGGAGQTAAGRRAGEITERIRELRKRITDAQTKVGDEGGDADKNLGALMDRAMQGDDAALAKLLGRLRGAGFAEMADAIELQVGMAKFDASPEGRKIKERDQRDAALDEQRRGRAGDLASRLLARNGSAISPADVTLTGVEEQLREMKVPEEQIRELASYVMEALRDAAKKTAEQLADDTDSEYEKLDKSNREWEVTKAYRAEKFRKKMAAFERTNPDWNAETDEMALMQSMARGVDDIEVRAGRGAAGRQASNAGLARGSRWRAGMDGTFDVRTVHRAVSLEEASKQLEENRYEALVARGMNPTLAREEAKAYGEKAYGAQMQRGYDAWRKLGEMQMTGQIGRGVQVMGSESYIDSVQTAREGIDKQMLDLMKKGVEAQVFLKEWARVNGVAARVGKRGKR